MIEIEQLVRESLARGATEAPSVPGLAADVKAAVRRQRRQRAAAVGAGLGVVSLVAAVTLTGTGGQRQVPIGPASPAPSSSEDDQRADAGALPAALIGTWQPEWIAEFTNLDVAGSDEPLVTFRADGRWWGSDGCNSLSGKYSLSSTGKFSAETGLSTAVGCSFESVPHSTLLSAAETVVVRGDTATFFDAGQRELGRYTRRPGGPKVPRWPGVHVPDAARLLIEPQDAVGSVRLAVRAQPVEGEPYRRFGLRVVCVGGGTFTVTINGEVAKPASRPCDGFELQITVTTKRLVHDVVVKATRGRFQVAALDR